MTTKNEILQTAEAAAQMGGTDTPQQAPTQGDPLDFHKPVGIAAVNAANALKRPKKDEVKL